MFILIDGNNEDRVGFLRGVLEYKISDALDDLSKMGY